MMFGAPKRLGGYGWMDPGTRRKKKPNKSRSPEDWCFFFSEKNDIFDFWGDDLLFLGRFVSFRNLGSGFKYFYAHPYLGKWSYLTNIFQMGWNHQLEVYVWFIDNLCRFLWIILKDDWHWIGTILSCKPHTKPLSLHMADIGMNQRELRIGLGIDIVLHYFSNKHIFVITSGWLWIYIYIYLLFSEVWEL